MTWASVESQVVSAEYWWVDEQPIASSASSAALAVMDSEQAAAVIPGLPELLVNGQAVTALWRLQDSHSAGTLPLDHLPCHCIPHK